MNQLEREQEYLEEQLNRGEISLAEFNREMREIQREYRAMAQEAAEEAYHNEIDRWY